VRRRIAGYMSSAVADGLYAARQDRELGEDAAHASESVYDD
jgi:hypothetical protein